MEIKEEIVEKICRDYIDNEKESVIFKHFEEREPTEKKGSFSSELAEKRRVLTKTEYIGWISQYLTKSRNNAKIYKNFQCVDACEELKELVQDLFGLDGAGIESEVCTKRNMGSWLKELKNKIEDNDSDMLQRLNNIEEDRIDRLTEALKKGVIHNRINTFFYERGFLIQKKDDGETVIINRKGSKDDRRKDVMLDIVEEFCVEYGYQFLRKCDNNQGIRDNFYLVTDNQEEIIALIKKLLAEEKERKDSFIFIPLAIDVITGIMFAIVGRDYYYAAYEKNRKKDPEGWKEYDDNKEEYFFCLDYFHYRSSCCAFELKSRFVEQRKKLDEYHGDVRDWYEKILDEFKIDYRTKRKDIIDQNGELPCGAPEVFAKFFQKHMKEEGLAPDDKKKSEDMLRMSKQKAEKNRVRKGIL